MACSSTAERPAVNRANAGSSPAVPARQGGSAHQAEHRPCKADSTVRIRDPPPTPGTLAQIARALDCRSRRCGLKSRASRQSRSTPPKTSSSVVEHAPDTRVVGCSIHPWSTISSTAMPSNRVDERTDVQRTGFRIPAGAPKLNHRKVCTERAASHRRQPEISSVG